MKFVTPAAKASFTIAADGTPPTIAFQTDGAGPHSWDWTITWKTFSKKGKVETADNKLDGATFLQDLGECEAALHRLQEDTLLELEAAQTGLDVPDRNLAIERGERRDEDRRRVALDDDRVGSLLGEHRVEHERNLGIIGHDFGDCGDRFDAAEHADHQRGEGAAGVGKPACRGSPRRRRSRTLRRGRPGREPGALYSRPRPTRL